MPRCQTFPDCIAIRGTARITAVRRLRDGARSSLGTTDRKIAERRLKEWIANLGKVDSAVEKTTLKQLHLRFIAISQGKADSTLCIIKAIVKEFESWWPYSPNPEVRNIRPSHIEEWLA